MLQFLMFELHSKLSQDVRTLLVGHCVPCQLDTYRVVLFSTCMDQAISDRILSYWFSKDSKYFNFL